FPHESTADQWFGESQFESYRSLGMHITEQAFGRFQNNDTLAVRSIDELFTSLHSYWYPPVNATPELQAAYAGEYSRVMEMVRADTNFVRLDHALFEALPAPDAKAPQISERDSFYVCNALLQLTENVYVGLDLERRWDHPHVQGWMKVFKRWAQQPEFRRAWKISEPTYARPFRHFYNERLRGRALGLRRGFVASHRGRVTPGANGHDNSMIAFQQAIDAGATVIALDVRKLATGELILSHEQDIDGRPLRTLAYAD